MKHKLPFFISILLLFICTTSYAQQYAIQDVDLHRAVPDGRVTEVWQGLDMPNGFSGKDVIIGITDWGFDYTHPVFYDTLLNDYRILRAWDQFKKSGPAPEGFNYGTEYIGKSALLEAQCDTSNIYGYNYHGNHVASIAGGAGGGTKYRGVAYDANLLFATFLIDEQAVMDAFRWMYNVAQNESKRLVINMSWGLYYFGNMDGTGKLADLVDSLTHLGVVFVTSAGNNGDVNFHLSHEFSSADTIQTQFNYAVGGGTPYWGQSISMTSDPNRHFSCALKVFDNQYNLVGESPFFNTAENGGYLEDFIVINENDTIYYTIFTENANSYNQRPQARLRVKKPANTYRTALVVAGEGGTFHAWNVAELTTGVGNWGGTFTAPQTGWKSGDANYGVGAPGNIESLISIASHKASFLLSTGTPYGGWISNYSSRGNIIDGREKPDLSAPGEGIVAALSSYTNQYSGQHSETVEFNGRSYRFVSLSGTSMSSPFAAGVAALVLQANPYLSSAQVKEILMETARQDEHTAEGGAIRWGTGKIDAHAAVLKALEYTGIHKYEPQTLQINLYPNPAHQTLYLTTISPFQHAEVVIYDLSGRVVMRQNICSGVTTLEIGTLASGCYVMKVTDGKEVIVKKWIKN